MNRKETVEKIIKKYQDLFNKDVNTSITDVVVAYIKGANLSSDQSVVKAAIKSLKKSGYLDKLGDVLEKLRKDRRDKDDKKWKQQQDRTDEESQNKWKTHRKLHDEVDVEKKKELEQRYKDRYGDEWQQYLQRDSKQSRNSRMRYSRDHYDFTPEEWKEINEIAAGLASEQGEDFYEMSGLEKDEYIRIAVEAYLSGSF